MSESDFVQQLLGELKSGEMDPQMKMALAQGMLPLDQNDLLEVLFELSIDTDEEAAKEAQHSLQELPDSVFIGIAEAASSPPQLLHSLARLRIGSSDVLRRLVLNKSAEDQTIELIGRNCALEDVLSLVSGNQERLLRHTVLFDVLLDNPSLSGFKRQQLATYKQELLDRGQLKVAQPEPEPEPVLEELEEDIDLLPELEDEPAPAARFDLDAMADFDSTGPFSAEEMVPFEAYAGRPPQTEEQKITNIYQLLVGMTVKDKLRLALFGSSEARNILVKDGDRKVAGAVLKNPKLQESDIERYAKMRNINDDVLKEIAGNRMWLRNYSIVQNLVNNPRTPLPISMNLMAQLRDNHVKMLLRNREVPAALRTAAGQRIAKKSAAASGGGSKH